MIAVGETVKVVKNAVATVASSQKVSLSVVGGAPAGLDVSFVCTDPLGCNDVIGGESREITMAVKGLVPGDYNFNVESPGVAGAIEQDRILVGAGEQAPGPYWVPVRPLAGVGCCAAAFKSASAWLQRPPEPNPRSKQRLAPLQAAGLSYVDRAILTRIPQTDQLLSRPNSTTNQHKKDINAAEVRQAYSKKTVAYPIGFAGIN